MVFHVPDPLALPGHSKLGSDRPIFPSDEERQEFFLGVVLEELLFLPDVAEDVFGNDGALPDSVDSCLRGEATICVVFHGDAVATSEDIRMRCRLEKVVDFKVAVMSCEV